MIKVKFMGNTEEYLYDTYESLLCLTNFNNITHIDCSNTPIETLDPLPLEILELKCNGCELQLLPETLPENIRYIDCSNNKMFSLPSILPPRLKYFKCSNNNLKAYLTYTLDFNDIPEGLHMECNNQIM